MLETIHISTTRDALALCKDCDLSVGKSENPFHILKDISTGANGTDGEFYYFLTYTHDGGVEKIENFYAISLSELEDY